MKKIWILERYLTGEEVKRADATVRNMLKEAETLPTGTDLAIILQRLTEHIPGLDDSVNGCWVSELARGGLNSFRMDARYILTVNKGHKFRVIEAETPDEAVYGFSYIAKTERPDIYEQIVATL